MKKIVLSILLLTTTMVSTVFASSVEPTILKSSIQYTDVSPFCKLIRAGNFDAVKAMIESGADVNKKSTGLTPLMFAARYNKVKIVKLLIKNGAKLKTKSDKGFTALKYAELSKATDALAVIKKALQK